MLHNGGVKDVWGGEDRTLTGLELDRKPFQFNRTIFDGLVVRTRLYRKFTCTRPQPCALHTDICVNICSTADITHEKSALSRALTPA